MKFLLMSLVIGFSSLSASAQSTSTEETVVTLNCVQYRCIVRSDAQAPFPGCEKNGSKKTFKLKESDMTQTYADYSINLTFATYEAFEGRKLQHFYTFMTPSEQPSSNPYADRSEIFKARPLVEFIDFKTLKSDDILELSEFQTGAIDQGWIGGSDYQCLVTITN
jgi:hypothetical protein